ncbi:MAG: DUF3575 domain-containing protein [Bacteroidales bacterium]|nr:DUF3575 domain-containing protein [Bacteroidales bacterium]
MKHYIFAIILAALSSSFSAQAQAPRIRTSAPPEKTAQTKGKVEAPAAPSLPAAQTGKPGKRKAETGAPGRFMALKTNLAYDAFAILNAEFEIQVARHFSVDVPVIWSLWDWKNDMGLRIVAVQPEVRYWLGNIGRGSAFGINAGVASYNFRHDDIRYQNTSGRPLVSASVSYTYVLPIDSRWSAEFSLAAGYANTQYNRYYNIDNGALINTKTRNYFGPTKIGISLSYRLGK